MRTLRFLPVSALAALAAAAPAQLIVGSTTPTIGVSGAYYLDVAAGSARQLWIGAGSGNPASRKVNGVAADAANGVVYGNDSGRLYSWNYGDIGVTPTFINGLYRATTSTTATAAPTGADDVMFARGDVYAFTDLNTGSPTTLSGIYKVDLTVRSSTPNTSLPTPNMTQVLPVTTGQYHFAGMTYDPTSGLVYATNTGQGTAANGYLGTGQADLGVYTIDLFGTKAITKVANFDSAYLANPDGIAVGGGKIWLSGKPLNANAPTDLANSLVVESLDMSTNAYGTVYTIPLAADSSARATGIAWAPGALNPVPEPAALLPLGLSVVAMLRRRRK